MIRVIHWNHWKIEVKRKTAKVNRSSIRRSKIGVIWRVELTSPHCLTLRQFLIIYKDKQKHVQVPNKLRRVVLKGGWRRWSFSMIDELKLHGVSSFSSQLKIVRSATIVVENGKLRKFTSFVTLKSRGKQRNGKTSFGLRNSVGNSLTNESVEWTLHIAWHSRIHEFQTISSAKRAEQSGELMAI